MDKEEAPPPTGKKKSTLYCCKPQCCNYGQVGLYFHLFPKDKLLKRKWEIALRMGKPASASMRVCSKHFLQKDYFPGGQRRHKLFPKQYHLKICQFDHMTKKHYLLKREKNWLDSAKQLVLFKPVEDKSVQPEIEDDVPAIDAPLSENATAKFTLNKSTQGNVAHDGHTSRKYDEVCGLADILCGSSLDKTTQVNLMPNCNENTTVPVALVSPKKALSLTDLLSTDEKLFTFTGLHSLDLLDGLVDCVGDLVIDASTNKKILPVKERIILTLVKLKLNISFTALGVLFDVSRQTCSNYFKTMCPILSRVLKIMVPWPEQESIRKNLPLSFKNYKATRIVLDCAETVIEKCKCLRCRILTYSHYKKNHTAKYDVGIAPSGLITEISLSYGGRASDKFIVNDSHILEKLDFEDKVMVNKGFRIEAECLQHHLHITLVRPPFLKKKQQLSREEALETADIAKARVHVERVIQRLPEFELLRGPIPWSLAPYFDDCLIIAAGLTNLGPPVIAIHRFM